MENTILSGAIALIFLTAMEIVLGIDNIVFIAVITGRLPLAQQPLARRLGLLLALVTRILLLFALSFILDSDDVVLFQFSNLGVATGYLAEHPEVDVISLRDLVLLLGGLFLIGKSVVEVHAQMSHEDGEHAKEASGFTFALVQIALLDVVFSLDSVITAVGMVHAEGEDFLSGISIMVTAIIIAVAVMMMFAEPVSHFVSRHPTVKMLALSFLILIGVMLVADAIGTHIPKGYIYFAMAFALMVELLNIRVRGRRPAQPAEAPA